MAAGNFTAHFLFGTFDKHSN